MVLYAPRVVPYLPRLNAAVLSDLLWQRLPAVSQIICSSSVSHNPVAAQHGCFSPRNLHFVLPTERDRKGQRECFPLDCRVREKSVSKSLNFCYRSLVFPDSIWLIPAHLFHHHTHFKEEKKSFILTQLMFSVLPSFLNIQVSPWCPLPSS